MIFFSAMAQPPYQPPQRRVAHRRASEMLQIAPPLRCGRCRAIREVCRKQILLTLAGLPGPSRRLSRSQRAFLALHPGEAFHRGEAHPEKAGGFALGCASLEGVNYLPSEIFGVGFHDCIISCGVNVFAHRCRYSGPLWGRSEPQLLDLPRASETTQASAMWPLDIARIAITEPFNRWGQN